MMKKMFFRGVLALLAAAVILTGCAPAASDKASGTATVEKKVKAGFVYIAPVGDYGWSNAHDVARKSLEAKFPWLETVIVEAVTDADSPRIIDRLVQEEKCDVIFTTSYDYMDNTVKAGALYPDTIFVHCSGFKRSVNVGTYFADLYQMYYLNGLMAGALTKTNKLGYVGAFAIPEVIRHIDAFALGVKETNPKATVDVRWINAWYDPAKAKEAAEALIAGGVDGVAFTEDTPAVVEVGQSHSEKGEQVYTFAHYSPMQQFGKDSVVSGQLVNWEVLYQKILLDVYTGIWKSEDLNYLVQEDAVLLGASMTDMINPKFVPELKAKMVKDPILGDISVYDLVMKRLAQMKEPNVSFEPFTGPVKDQSGAVRIPAGTEAPFSDLLQINYFVSNVKGDL